MLSEIPQDFISELIITSESRGGRRDTRQHHWSSPQWLTSDFLSGGAGALVHVTAKRWPEYGRRNPRLPQTQLREYAPASDVQCLREHYLASWRPGSVIHGSRSSQKAAGCSAPSCPVTRAQQQRLPSSSFRGPLSIVVPPVTCAAVPRPTTRICHWCFAAHRRPWYVDEAKT